AFSVSNRYTGQTLDEETGLYYYGARYYDPELARFIQADSTVPDPEFSQAYNRYAYVYNNPLKFSDPTGQNPFLIAWGIIEAVLATEVTVLGVTMAAWQVGLIAGTVNAVIAGVTGGDPLTAFAAGFVGGVFAANWGIVGSIAAGALGSAIQGGDPLMGAMTAGVSAGVAAVCQQTPLASVFDGIEDEFLKGLIVSTTSGALAGGVTAEMFGGDFGQGAAHGAASAAAGYAITVELTSFLGDLIAGAGKAARVTYKTVDAKGTVRKYHEKWAGDMDHNDFELMLDKVIAAGERITYFEYVGHGLEGDLFWGDDALLQSHHITGDGYPFMAYRSRILAAFSPEATIELEACQSAYGSSNVARSFKAV
ncbi:MAG: hypothetical protein GTN65_12100, partial [Armatimonadetes bacterium]|nr:hypothetical protein [Armatimonadota bacterium]NIO97809.1 hypothetical protein [Armatimonadota bacterium]